MKKPEIITTILVFFTFLFTILYYPQMPAVVATHWNFDGNVDGYMVKFWGTFIVPIVSLAVCGLLFLFLKADPLIKGTKTFKVYPEWVFVIVVGFLGYLQILLLSYNVGSRFDMTLAILPAFAALFIALGYVIQHTPRNYTVGIRTPWTLAEDVVWQKTHVLGGKLFMGAGLLSFLGYAFPKQAYLFMILPVVLAVLFLVFYSYILHKDMLSVHVREKKPAKPAKQANPAKQVKRVKSEKLVKPQKRK